MAAAATNNKRSTTSVPLRRAAAVALATLLAVVAALPVLAQSESCSEQLADLVSCGPYVVPGQPADQPSSQCCNSLKAVDTNCACNTIKIIQSLPAECGLAPVKCRKLLPSSPRMEGE
uniref:Bifunctional inhibitor/plant lipid transfer protein/seed storage helical domain-containing protein n=1 Tax=Ananas comosus var. bracteatus TaxID=296719 RepID=A0A6V7NSA7_ANACO|nr:unnamed protein product [Ananas comosus var. bracteatus]